MIDETAGRSVCPPWVGPIFLRPPSKPYTRSSNATWRSFRSAHTPRATDPRSKRS